MADDRDEHIDRLTYDAMTGIVRGERLRDIVSAIFHAGMKWRFDQADIQAALKLAYKDSQP